MEILEERLTRRAALRAGAGVGVGALIPFALAACGSSSKTPNGSGSGAKSLGSTNVPAPSLTTIVGNAPLHVAAELNYWKDSGLGVSLADVDGTNVIRVIQTTADLGISGTLPDIITFTKGVSDLRIIAPAYSAAQNTFITRKDSPINSYHDLKPGVKIGASVPATPPTYFATLLAQKAGLTVGKTAKLVSLGEAPASWSAVEHGLVDVTWSNPPYDTQLILAGKAKRVVPSWELRPEWVDLAITTTSQKLKSDAGAIKAFVEGFQRAQKLIVADPETAGAAWAKRVGITRAVAVSALKSAPKQAWSTSLSMPGVQAGIAAGRTLGLLSGSVDLNTLVTTV